jgi:hypothetical protein
MRHAFYMMDFIWSKNLSRSLADCWQRFRGVGKMPIFVSRRERRDPSCFNKMHNFRLFYVLRTSFLHRSYLELRYDPNSISSSRDQLRSGLGLMDLARADRSMLRLLTQSDSCCSIRLKLFESAQKHSIGSLVQKESTSTTCIHMHVHDVCLMYACEASANVNKCIITVYAINQPVFRGGKPLPFIVVSTDQTQCLYKPPPWIFPPLTL